MTALGQTVEAEQALALLHERTGMRVALLRRMVEAPPQRHTEVTAEFAEELAATGPSAPAGTIDLALAGLSLMADWADREWGLAALSRSTGISKPVLRRRMHQLERDEQRRRQVRIEMARLAAQEEKATQAAAEAQAAQERRSIDAARLAADGKRGKLLRAAVKRRLVDDDVTSAFDLDELGELVGLTEAERADAAWRQALVAALRHWGWTAAPAPSPSGAAVYRREKKIAAAL
jgi:hypothetical protein